MSVLVISSSTDAHVNPITEKLKGLGVSVIRLDTDLLACKDISLRITPTSEMGTLFDRTSLDLRDVTAVWYRRPKTVDLSKFALSRDGLSFARDEWLATLRGLYAFLDKALWVSPPHRIRVAENKVLQLRLAKEIGFVVPRTLITNNKQDAVEFWKRLEGKVVVKSIGFGWFYVNDDKESGIVRSVMTNLLDRTWLDNLDSLQVAPVLFQEAIPKLYELRITVIGGRVFAAKIDSQSSELARIDWRRDASNVSYSTYKLPGDLEEKSKEIVHRLGLQFGAIDVIRTPSGKYVFLEINPNGQFLWLESKASLPLSDAMARLLSGLAPALA